jgi:uncharacterized protein (TIGR02246 family)
MARIDFQAINLHHARRNQIMRKTASLLILGAALALLASSWLGSGNGQTAGPGGNKVAPAKESAKDEKDRPEDREAIRKSADEFVQAFEKGDAKTLAAMWTEQGEYHDDNGVSLRGRPAIEKAYAEMFKAKPKGKIEVDIRSIRFLGKDAAVEDGVLRTKPAGAELPSATFYSALHVREDGKWKIASVQESGAGEDKLEDISWLIGTWTARVKNREMEMQFAWNAKKTQIRNQFTAKEDGKVTISGTQTITFDPQYGRIRSWLHDDDGGHGQSLWYRDGNRWVLDALGVLPNGRATSSTNIITRLGDHEFLWRSTHRLIENSSMPDADPVKLTRSKSGQ